MSENRKLKKRNLHGEESDGKEVVKIQKQKKQKVKNVVLTEQSLQADSSKKPKLKKKNKVKAEEIIISPVSEKMQKKRKAKVDNTHISESEAISEENMRGKKRKLNKTKNKRKAEQIITTPVDETQVDGDKSSNEVVNADGTQVRNRKPKKSNKKKKMDLTSTEEKEINTNEEEEDVYQISSGDEDCSNGGMKKWVTDYYENRPGLDVLQKRIDDFITAHEENLEQEKQNREAKAAEGGWTVVVHHKGRKKTTESESGTAVGSVSQVALEDQLAKKKQNEPVAHGFYRFQRQEAKLNDILTLQSKFEQDKKRIQQLRAARKFKPFGIRLVDEA